MKREVAFALEARSQFTCYSGRTRSSKHSPAQFTAGRSVKSIEKVHVNSRSKRVKTSIPVADVSESVTFDQSSVAGEESVAPEVVAGEETAPVKRFTRSALARKMENVEEFGAPTRKNLELKMSKKIGLGRVGINLRKVLETGLLEGVRVSYDFDTEGKNLQGIINGGGILCSCSLCESTKVISPSQFEMHACKQYRHAIKHIRLENGKSLLEVIEICKASASDSVEAALQTVISSLPVKGPSMCTKCNGLIEALSTENLLVCDLCVNKKQVEAKVNVVTHGQVGASSASPKVSIVNLLVCDSFVNKKQVEAEPSVVTLGQVRASILEPKASTENLLAYDSCVNKKQVEGEPSVATRGQVRASSPDPKASESNSNSLSISFVNKNKRGRPRKAVGAAPEASIENLLVCDSFVNKKQVEDEPSVVTHSQVRASILEPKASTENLLAYDSCVNKKQVEAEPIVVTRGQVRASSLNPKASESNTSESNTSSISFDNKKKRGRPRKSSNSALKPVTSAGKFKVSGIKRLSKILERSPTSASVPGPIKSGTKLTIKNQQFHWTVFRDGGLPEGTELTYVVHGKKRLNGYKLGNGISCSCCNTKISASQFEAHAGCASRKKPYENIFTSNGVSLHEYAVSLKKNENRTHSVNYNDDVCRVCRDGGDLLVCDGCPRSFHQECIDEPSIPHGKWYCRYCQQSLKVDGESKNALAAGRVTGVDPMKQIKTRCMHIIKPSENIDLGACILCRCLDFSKSGFNDRTVIVCDQCEKEYHIGCLREHNMADLKKLPKGEWFCCNDCGRINSVLKNLLTREPETLPDEMLTFYKDKQNNNNNSETDSNLEMKFVVLRGKSATSETKKLLAQAVDIFHEGFDPITDVTSGQDFIPSMVYGRKIWSQDFAGMLCAILTIDSKVVTAGTLRVFGEHIAELPIVATSKSNQGKGYFQLLFTCIEKLLSSLKIKKIVLPAAEEAKSIWTQKFGFETIAPDQLNELRKSCSAMMTFQGTSMLQKEVVQVQDGVADAGDHGLLNPVVE